MTLLVQDDDGTISGANGYVTSDYVDTYFTNRGLADSLWLDLDDDVKDAAIVSATAYIDMVNFDKAKGIRSNEVQSTLYPRDGVYDRDGYSVTGMFDALQRATAEYAKRAAISELAPDLEYDDTGVPLKSKKEKIGPIEETTVYQDNVLTPNQIKKYPAADLILKPYLYNTGSDYSIVRG